MGGRGFDFLKGDSGDDSLNGGRDNDTCITDDDDTSAPRHCE